MLSLSVWSSELKTFLNTCWNRLQRRLWMPHPCRHSRPGWMWLWAAWAADWWPCTQQGVGAGWALWAFATQAMLWFCDTIYNTRQWSKDKTTCGDTNKGLHPSAHVQEVISSSFLCWYSSHRLMNWYTKRLSLALKAFAVRQPHSHWVDVFVCRLWQLWDTQ